MTLSPSEHEAPALKPKRAKKPKKPAMTPRDNRQLRAQTALLAIRDSDDDPQVKLAELCRLRAFLEVVWQEVSDEMSHNSQLADDFEVRVVRLEQFGVSDEPGTREEQGDE
jgi:hypothetical protein